jgi:pseudouridine-5'-phosphate glycosidase/pseudouridine kinase
MASRLVSPLLRVHPNVASALATKKPVVALESTIITHGLPFPANIETAIAIEQAVRDQGAVPATTAFIDGKAYVGLENDQLQRLAEIGLKATKTSRRDVASVLAAGKGSIGATTVSGTTILAHMAGISIFGTGGIGGVHRGGQDTMDVSADLTELSRTPVAVFCSGAKSILDIPRTLEYLETFGVSTHTFNPSGQFPAFYSAQSGCKVPIALSFRHAAQLIHSNMLFNMQSGMIFGVPIPAEYEAAGKKIQIIVEQAVQEAKEAGIDRRGKEVTPWLLKRVGELSQGQSITSNKALVINNVTTAAKVACELQVLQEEEAIKASEKGSRSYLGTNFDGNTQTTKIVDNSR